MIAHGDRLGTATVDRRVRFRLPSEGQGAALAIYLKKVRFAKAIDKWEWHEKSFKIFTCFISRLRGYMAGYELNPNRDVKRR